MTRKIQPKQVDLEKLSSSLDLAAKAPINNPTFTGEVNVPAVGNETNTIAATVGYVEEKFDKLIGNTSEIEGALDTIKELETAIGNNKDLIEAIQDTNTTYDLIGSSSATNGNAGISLVSSKHDPKNGVNDEDIIKITGTGSTQVISDAGGNIIVDGIVDSTLTKNGIAADSKAVGDKISEIKLDYNESIISLSVEGTTVTYIKGDGTIHSFETQDTNTTYSLGTDTVTGLTKIYATTGSAEDGTMSQKAITAELNKKVGVTIDNAQSMLIFTI